MGRDRPDGHLPLRAEREFRHCLGVPDRPGHRIATEVQGSPFAAGHAPQDIAVDPSGAFVYVANINSGDVSAYAIDSTSGALAEVAGSPFLASGSRNTGSGARSVTIDPSGRFAYVGDSSARAIFAYRIGPGGGLLEIEGSPLAGSAQFTSVAVEPSGRFAYATDSARRLSVYRRDGATGALTFVEEALTGIQPNAVEIDPTGRFAYVANYGPGNVSAYAIDPTSGALAATGTAPTASNPRSIAIEASGRFAYVANQVPGNVSIYEVDGATGALAEIAGSPVAAGAAPRFVATTGSIE
ncbi:MAG TPA: beta-propeller fold lactonase family protein [Thermodesulfobacteriota bacterium]